MKLMQLIKQIKDLKDEVTGIPQDVLHSINQFIDVLNQNGFNLDKLTEENLGNNKRDTKLDLSSIMNLLPSGSNALGGLNLAGMNLKDIMKLMQLIKQIKDLKDEVTGIPQDVLHSINQFIDV